MSLVVCRGAAAPSSITHGVQRASSKVEDLGLTIAQRVDHVDSCTGHATFHQLSRELLSQVNQMLTGHKLPPYKAPTMPTLGGALDSAPSRYGEPDGNVFNQAFWDGYSAAEWADETGGRIGDRVRSGVSASREVVETSDARSYLPRPQGEDPEIESIRWSAGPIFGGVDWIWEELFGYSLIEEITKPFVGDWERMREASQAWTHAGDALTAISQNYMGLLPPLAVWQGKGSEMFLAAAGVVSQAHTVAAAPNAALIHPGVMKYLKEAGAAK